LAVALGSPPAGADDSKLGKESFTISAKNGRTGKGKVCCGYPLSEELGFALRFYWLAMQGPDVMDDPEEIEVYTRQGFYLGTFGQGIKRPGGVFFRDGRFFINDLDLHQVLAATVDHVLELRGQWSAAPEFPADGFIVGLFLSFTLWEIGFSIREEQTRGTLPRLMTTPTPTGEIILGKMGGTFLSGLLQFAILVLASTYLFDISWGSSPLGVATIMVLTVFAAAGLGALLTTFARNENQASIIASAVSLTFGALGGSFFPASSLTGVVDIASKLTINRWAMEGFTKLTAGGAGFSEILPEAGILAIIGLVTFILALRGFKRRFVI